MTETDTAPETREDSDMLHRSILIRSFNADTREFTGIAVPWDTEARVRDWWDEYIEEFERGSVQDSDNALVYWRHEEPIGKLVGARDTDEGWEITGRLSDTPRGNEGYQLLKDEVITELSIGFIPEEWREEVLEGGTVKRIRTKVKVREVSLVPFGAYGQSATVSQVRERANPQKKEEPPMGDTITRADLDDLQATIADINRKVDVGFDRDAPHVTDNRTAGEVLKAIVGGDDATIREYNDLVRAYTGGTTADAVAKPGWVGDLTRIFDASSSVLSNFFSTGALPDSGMSIEYAELASNTIVVNEQAAEGDDITFGKVSITTKTAPVKTYAGGTELTRQEIERSSIGVLNTSLDALAMAAGARKKANMRASYVALVAAREAIVANAGVVLLGATLGASVAGNWEDALIDAAIKFEAENLTLDGMFVSGTVFKKLRSLTVAGERVFQTYKDNASGELNLPGLSGSLAGLQVRLDTGAAGDKAAFANKRAIRQYDSALVSLQDENIVNLSKSFAVYRYGAVAAEIPAGVVPVKLAAA